MADLVRLSFSIEAPLVAKLEQLLEQSTYTNRSEFIRDLIRDRLVQRLWTEDQEAVGALTIVYDHHASGLTEKLTALQHIHHSLILAVTHVHLDRDICVEVILVKGQASQIQEMLNKLRRHKGVFHGTLSITSTGSAWIDPESEQG